MTCDRLILGMLLVLLIVVVPAENLAQDFKLEVRVGIEPTNNGFANHAISHSGTAPQKINRLEFSHNSTCSVIASKNDAKLKSELRQVVNILSLSRVGGLTAN